MGNVIATHAGIQHNWFVNEFKGELNGEKSIAEQLNSPQNLTQMLSLFDVGKLRRGGMDVGGIYWCDREELKKPLKGYIQVVGHNRVNEIKRQINYKKPNQSEVYYIDCLGTKLDYLKLEIGTDNAVRRV